jgi:uncharacterized protein YneF (UPF0154 family)
MSLNSNKSVCMRIGPDFKRECAAIITKNGDSLRWVDRLRYLGVVFMSAKTFQASLADNKRSYYRSVNSVFSKVGRHASEEVLCKLVNSKCVPSLLYGLEAVPLTTSHRRTLDFVCNRTHMKIFRTRSLDIVTLCYEMMNISLYSVLIDSRKERFLMKFFNSDNLLCKMIATGV